MEQLKIPLRFLVLVALSVGAYLLLYTLASASDLDPDLVGDPDLTEQELQESFDDESTVDDENEEFGQPRSDFSLKKEVLKYQKRFPATDTHTKVTDNRGHGDRSLYGTRNFRVVLYGVMYRGGANNKYYRRPRSNMNPLPREGLMNLCRSDFSNAVYLYSENFGRAPRSVTCQQSLREEHTLTYKQYSSAGENKKILRLIYARIKGQIDGPIYAHCWNGWHSSGLISGMALKQFCGWSNRHVESYWSENTDGNSRGYKRIRARLRNFQPYEEFKITPEERSMICPKK